MQHHHMAHHEQHMAHHEQHMDHQEHVDHQHPPAEGHDHSNHHDHHEIMIADFRQRFWVSLVLSIPVLILSPMIQNWFGFQVQFPGRDFVLFGISGVVFGYGGWPFLKGFINEIRGISIGMMTLIAIAISVAFLYSSAVVFGLPGKLFFWELVTLIDVMLIGHLYEMRSIMGASKALQLLVNMMPSQAHQLHDEHVMEVNVDQLKRGDVILVKPGEKVPVDGMIIEGESYLDESLLTGESKPVQKSVDQGVIGGSINGNGSLIIKVRNAGKEGYLNKVIQLIEQAQQSKSKTQNLANTAAKWLSYIALGTGLVTFLIWYFSGYEMAFVIERTVTVMVVSCPHALGLAIPLVVAISTAISAQNGLLIRNRTAFENSRKITAIVFDKTGTLTKGLFGVTRYESLHPDFTKDQVLRFAGALEQHSEHPIAKGLVNYCTEQGMTLPTIKNFNAIIGRGIEASSEGNDIKVVSPGYLEEQNIDIPRQVAPSGYETVVFVIVNQLLVGYVALADSIRQTSKTAVQQFKREGVKVIMATGDNQAVAKAVSGELGLDGFHAEVLPHEKVQIVKDLQREGHFVAMSGDGVNDAPALAQADVGIAVGSGTDVAAETADIILSDSDPKDILSLIQFGKVTYKKMVQNLVWATGYNTVAIPLAAGVLFPYGFVLNPAIGAIFMSLSTIIVAANAQLLKHQIKR